MLKTWLKEKTTWLGFFAVGAAFGFDLSEAQQTALAALAASFFYMNDRG
jgi:hypothetical protein